MVMRLYRCVCCRKNVGADSLAGHMPNASSEPQETLLHTHTTLIVQFSKLKFPFSLNFKGFLIYVQTQNAEPSKGHCPAPITGVTSNTHETFLLTVPFPGALPVSSTLQASLTVRTEPNIFTKSRSLPLNFPCRSNNSDPQLGSAWRSCSFVLEMVTPGCEVSSQPLLCQELFPGSSHPLESRSLQNPHCSVQQTRSRLAGAYLGL